MSRVPTAFLVAAALLAAVQPLSSPRAETPVPDGWTLEGVVLYGRHSLRSPTGPVPCHSAEDRDCFDAMAARPWPNFGVAAGNLLPEAYPRVRTLGRYLRGRYAGTGLLPASGCPTTKVAAVLHSDDERTTMTAGALSDGLAPGCAIEFHPDADTYSGGPACAVDRTAVPAAALAFVGGSWAARTEGDLMRPLAILNEVLGPFAPGGCERYSLAAGCSVATAPADEAPEMASAPAEQLLFEYAAGYPESEVGWGRLAASAGLPLGAAVTEVNKVHALALAAASLPPAIGTKPGSKSLHLVLGSLAGFAAHPRAAPAPIVAYVSHDNIILHLAGMLGLAWDLESYNPHQIPPGGVIAFELWRTAEGALMVRAVYIAQTVEQLRTDQPLDAANPPATSVMAIDGCPMAGGACPWTNFETIARAKIDPACTGR
jgi:4-phytase/acid phosphatase